MGVNKIKRQITLFYKGYYLIVTPNNIETLTIVPQEIKEDIKKLVSNLSYLYNNYPIPRFGKITEEQIQEANEFIELKINIDETLPTF